MTQGFNTTAMPVIVDGITNSNSAFGANEEGEAVFFNTRIVERMNLEEGQTVYAHCIPNYEDKRDQIPWRCIRIEEELEKRNIPGNGRHETVVIKKFFEENDEVWTLEEIARETRLSEDVVEHVLELRPDLFKEVTAYVLVS